MWKVYLLKSETKNWFYVGMCSDIDRRISEHNGGKVKSTKAYKPLFVVYTKEFETRIEARDYEKYLKIRCNKEVLLQNLGYL